jgi:hypothetical protein
MSSFVKNNMKLISQGITGFKVWAYTDTGAIADIQDVAGYFGPAGDMGVDSGDFIFISANNGLTNHLVYGSAFAPIQDTGTSQGTVGPATLIGDTN